MREEVFMAGLGGQGVVLAGQLLAQAATNADLEVSWFPMYSPEVRGGEATCTLVYADQRVGSPVCGRPRAVMLMDPLAIANHIGVCAPGGLAVLNTSLGIVPIQRADLTVIPVPADDIAAEAGSERAMNMVMLGAYLGVKRPELVAVAIAALAEVLPERHHRHMPMNAEALRRGAALARG
jgi:2-oxoglutarate ferredoxin oxidoreductase subunit gamma